MSYSAAEIAAGVAALREMRRHGLGIPLTERHFTGSQPRLAAPRPTPPKPSRPRPSRPHGAAEAPPAEAPAEAPGVAQDAPEAPPFDDDPSAAPPLPENVVAWGVQSY